MDNLLDNIAAQLRYLTHDEIIALGCAWVAQTDQYPSPPIAGTGKMIYPETDTFV